MIDIRELLDIAQMYSKLGDYERASVIYKEVICKNPKSDEATFARVQLISLSGSSFSSGLILLPFPLDQEKRELGGVEALTLGPKKYLINIPSGVQIGQKIRLRQIAHHISPLLQGDIHLLVNEGDRSYYQIKRDVQIDLPINFSDVKRGITRRLNIEGNTFDVKIPVNARSGTKLCLRNKGEIINGGFPGDIVLKIVNDRRPTWSWVGVFDRFGDYGPSKFSIRFTLPWFFEIGGEWEFHKTYTQVHMRT